MVARQGRRPRTRFTILVMTLLSITVLTLDAKDVPVLGSIRSGMMRALSPVESVAQLRKLVHQRDKQVALLIQRGDNRLFVPVPLG